MNYKNTIFDYKVLQCNVYQTSQEHIIVAFNKKWTDFSIITPKAYAIRKVW